jgi:hypothetical protein
MDDDILLTRTGVLVERLGALATFTAKRCMVAAVYQTWGSELAFSWA